MRHPLATGIIPLTIRLVHTEQINYVGSGDCVGLDRTRLQIPNGRVSGFGERVRNTWARTSSRS